ncbi:MAG: 4-oxalocrotonate tautomerase family protein [Burkholderiaceae bacterium]
MPVIRVEVPEGTTPTVKRNIRLGVKQAVLDTLAPKETKYDYVAVSEVFADIGDGVPLVTVDLRPGREADRKKALVDAIAALLKTELNIDPKDLYVLFRENPAENHYTGGQPLPPWVPASELGDN